ncbi:MarR family winged helix-turn-helix transcriptional regulator [Dehalococcoides mccartyi]|jgi:DNA-binding MarR family transcriptional regulator|uniref:MarR family winged helix-turn-helix transcriptional regulator n=1 Tax=Dehalococcoides mccartyi TaxID=61435 RepID=UPI0003C82FAF|nr:MarR family winged helix-turn-helix transcriptional regulator [Dehalococcoides mccartyi]AHB14149.1 MarR family transcriptional regulator [Dehalococcoides mccartyi GY50]
MDNKPTDINIFADDPELDLIHALVRVTRSLDRAITKCFIGQSKITPEQDAVLQMLNIRSKLSIDELSAMLVREHNTISSLVDRMEKAGLLIKHKDRTNSNKVTVEMSPKVCEIWNAEIVKSIFRNTLSKLSETEKAQIKEISKKITEEALDFSRHQQIKL